MKKVLMVAGREFFGGAADELVEMCSQFTASQRIGCSVLVPSSGKIADRLLALGVRVNAAGHSEYLVPPQLIALRSPPAAFVRFSVI